MRVTRLKIKTFTSKLNYRFRAWVTHVKRSITPGLGHIDLLCVSDVPQRVVSRDGPYILHWLVREVDEVGWHRHDHDFSQLAVSCCVLCSLPCPQLEVAEIGKLSHVYDAQQPVQSRSGLCDLLCSGLVVGKRGLNHDVQQLVRACTRPRSRSRQRVCRQRCSSRWSISVVVISRLFLNLGVVCYPFGTPVGAHVVRQQDVQRGGARPHERVRRSLHNNMDILQKTSCGE